MTVYLTNATSRKPPFRGPGRLWSIMAAPRANYGEAGEGRVEALVPPLEWVRRAKDGSLPFEEYRERFTGVLRGSIEGRLLQPGRLLANTRENGEPTVELVGEGDTLICACSRAQASQGRCHRVWCAGALFEAGWDVVLDGVRFPQLNRSGGST